MKRFPARELYSEFAAVYSELANNLAAMHVERQRKGFRGGAIQGFLIKRDGGTIFPIKRRSDTTLRKLEWEWLFVIPVGPCSRSA